MTKQELARYGQVKRECEQLREQTARIEAIVYSAKGQIITDMPKGTAQYDSMGTAVERLIDLQDRYFKRLSELCGLLLEIENAVDKLKDPAQRAVIRYRYIDCMKWSDICRKMNYEERQIFYIHKRALERLQ